MLLVATASLCLAAPAERRGSPTNPTFIHSGTPGGVPPSSDCSIRKLAFDYGRHISPRSGGFRNLFDALQLGACGETPPPPEPRRAPANPIQRRQDDEAVIFVDANAGDDANAGTDEAAPLQTVRAAVDATRAARGAGGSSAGAVRGRPATIVLRGGVHQLDDTVTLDARDSHLTIRNYPGEDAVVSGGVNLTASWKPSAVCKGCFEADLSGQVATVPGLRRDGVREIRARYPNFDPELGSVIGGVVHVHDGEDGWITEKTSWVPSGSGMNGVSPWPPANPNPSVYVMTAADWPSVEWPMSITTNGSADPDTWTGEGDWGEYWLGVGGTCVDRSPPAGYWCAPGAPRHISVPNHPSGIHYSQALLPNAPYANAKGAYVHAWRPGHWYTNIFRVGEDTKPNATNQNVTTTWKFYKNINNVFGRPTLPPRDQGTLRFLGRFDTLEACETAVNITTKTPRGPLHSWTYHHKEFGGPWATTCWGDTSFTWTGTPEQNIDSGTAPGFPLNPDDPGGATLMFDAGGFQGGEGVTDGEAWYIENVLEELDIGREWFFNESTSTMYYKPNNTDTPTGTFVATKLKVLFNVSGTQKKPAIGVKIQGLTLRDTAFTYMDPHGLPSGGDWGLQKQGAITVVGTEGVDISGNLLTRLDGNGVFIGSYNRNLTITQNDFEFIGDSAMASWGETSTNLNENKTVTVPYTVGPDGRGGNQPRGTVVAENTVREIGLWQKQSSLWFQAVTTETTLKNNIFFNGPRAALNFNDGFGGGDEIAGNLLVNTCRESSDHGPWNSWDRVPYITTLRTGKPSIMPKDRNIHGNFIMGTYNSQETIDTDDGSAYINVIGNVLAYADNGLKSDFGGHDEKWWNNLLLYVGNCYHMWSFKGYNDGFFNNSCVFRGEYDSDCNAATGWEVHDNTVYSQSGVVNIAACNTTLDKWVMAGHDRGSSGHAWPSDAEMTAMARALLGF